MEALRDMTPDWHMADLDITSPLRAHLPPTSKRLCRNGSAADLASCSASASCLLFPMIQHGEDRVDDRSAGVCRSEFTDRQQTPTCVGVSDLRAGGGLHSVENRHRRRALARQIGVSDLMDTGIIDIILSTAPPAGGREPSLQHCCMPEFSLLAGNIQTRLRLD